MTFYDLTNTGAEIQEAITKALNSVDLDSAQDIEGIKNFTMGFQVPLEAIQLTDYTGTNLWEYIDGRLEGKQDSLTFDTTPTESSTNPVTSGGVYTALEGTVQNLAGSASSYSTIIKPGNDSDATPSIYLQSTATTVSYDDAASIVVDGNGVTITAGSSGYQDATMTYNGEVVATASDLESKQDTLTFDSTPTEDSENPVTSGGVYDAIAEKQDTLTFDSTPTEDSENPVTSGGVYDALAEKQDTLTFDSTPTEDSENPVTSGGVYDAIAEKQDTLTFDTTPTESSTNPVTSGGIYEALADVEVDLSDYSTTTEMETAIASAIEDKADVSALASYTPTTSFATINGSSITGGGDVTIVAADADTITIDASPTSGSSNAVSSDGTYSAIEGGYYY